MTQLAEDAETASSPKKSGVDYSKFDSIVDSDDEKPAEEKDSQAQKPKEKPHCANCMKEIVKPLRCGVCKKVEYCSQQCQREDWQFHKRVCKKPQEPKKNDDKTSKQESEKKEPARPKAEDKVVVDDEEENLTWYRHREWKPTSEPKKEFKPVQITGDAAAAAAAATESSSKTGAGSAWNSAGTWEDKDETSKAKSMLRAKLEDFAPLDVAGGTLSISEVESVDGEASKPVVRGTTRHLWDLSLKVKFEFKWMDSDGQKSADGTLSVSDFTQNTSFDAGGDSLTAPVVDISFKGASKVDPARWAAVGEALSTKDWPPRDSTLMATLAARMKAFAEEFNQAG